jgi:hypothetical protein
MRTCDQPAPAGLQKLTTSPDLGGYAVRSYSLMRPRTGRGLIRSWERSATWRSGQGWAELRLR